ncbi:hypothetical protein [Streptomyces sp. L2]|uniref:hypothetical protein n=1 Tax=Streptomyces sp. L2 TaxID=2162665 RepID=UPI00101385E5|nr:hypothetical protein [Streptomyces sp. L2]
MRRVTMCIAAAVLALAGPAAGSAQAVIPQGPAVKATYVPLDNHVIPRPTKAGAGWGADADRWNYRSYDGMTTWVSPNNRARLVMQHDGNFVVYVDGVAKWATYTSVNPNDRNDWQIAVWQEDGNLVVYKVNLATDARRAVWQSGTSGRGMLLAIQDDCNVVIYSGSGQPLWQTGTNVCS